MTIGYGTTPQASRATFTGTPAQVSEDIIECFGLDAERFADTPLSDIVLEATSVAVSLDLVARKLGGRLVAEPDAAPQKAAESAAQPASLLDRITGAPDVAVLQRLWVDNQAAFADPQIMAAWKARGRALQAVQAAAD
ncbi:hypothetical protein [Pilimelia terevasa]|uniref:hypothetical protein n=1 Tax=Pilimelia terevasa TaxID=53372 RepID=UPI00166EF98C|nr:hypothetical protein [Pilimelia terevasa]